MNTPTLDKFGLHPVGGYCTCYSNPYARCDACAAVRAHKERWDGLSADDRKKALAESAAAYPPSSNQDGR
jgi:hypothetical protein